MKNTAVVLSLGSCLIALALPVSGYAQSPDQWVITGAVLDSASGLPVQADILVTGLGVEPARAGFSAYETDPLGQYRIFGNGSGPVTLVAKAAGYAFSRQSVTAGQGNVAATVDFELDRPASVRGRVLDGYGNPVGNAIVRVLYTGYPPDIWRTIALTQEVGEVKTNDSGEFAIVNVAPGTEVVLEAGADGYVPGFSQSLALAPKDALTNAVITLTRGPTLAGTVVGGDGAPIGGAKVALRFRGSRGTLASYSIESVKRANRVVLSNSRGEFVFEATDLAPQELLVTHQDYLPVRWNVFVDTGLDGSHFVQISMERR